MSGLVLPDRDPPTVLGYLENGMTFYRLIGL